MGVKHDVAEFSSATSVTWALGRRDVFSLADAPSVALAHRVATMAEHLAFECGQHVLMC
jgi:vacuolar-type H+-ATPase subunit B/Vma2